MINKKFSIKVDSITDVKTLKLLIEAVTGLNMRDQILRYQGKRLKDDFSLEYFSITNNSIVLPFPLKRKQFKITVTIDWKDTLILDSFETDLIRKFKKEIQEKTDFPIDSIEFFKCPFTAGDIVKYYYSKANSIQVFIKNLTGEHIEKSQFDSFS